MSNKEYPIVDNTETFEAAPHPRNNPDSEDQHFHNGNRHHGPGLRLRSIPQGAGPAAERGVGTPPALGRG